MFSNICIRDTEWIIYSNAFRFRCECVDYAAIIYTDMHRDGGAPDIVERIKGQLPLKRGGKLKN